MKLGKNDYVVQKNSVDQLLLSMLLQLDSGAESDFYVLISVTRPNF